MRLLERVLSVLAPHSCLGCGAAGTLVCPWCLPELFAPLPSRCYRCHAATADSAICPKCRRSSKLRHVWVASEYAGVSKQLIHVLKFERTQAAAAPIAKVLAAALPYFDAETIFTHIPAATSRVRMRGYDQSQLIARQLASNLSCRHSTLLQRHGQSRQVGAKRAARITQLEDAFTPLKSAMVKNARVVLVDDVVTTGATLQQAAAVLKQAGAKSIDAAVFAQKL